MGGIKEAGIALPLNPDYALGATRVVLRQKGGWDSCPTAHFRPVEGDGRETMDEWRGAGVNACVRDLQGGAMGLRDGNLE